MYNSTGGQSRQEALGQRGRKVSRILFRTAAPDLNVNSAWQVHFPIIIIVDVVTLGKYPLPGATRFSLLRLKRKRRDRKTN